LLHFGQLNSDPLNEEKRYSHPAVGHQLIPFPLSAAAFSDN